MQGDPTRSKSAAECQALEGLPHINEWSNEERTPQWADADAGASATRQRLARLARTIEADVIPRLVQAHRPAVANPATGGARPASADVTGFVSTLIHASEAEVDARVAQLRAQGVSVESIYLDLFAPTARRLGEMWEDDTCDFSTVTVALGRLQRLLRELSPAFGTEVDHPANGRRALFIQPRDEQHSFGLSMVAEFFRRDGWDVIGGVGGAVTDPGAKVRSEWVDIVGFSIGSDSRLPWLRESVVSVRACSRNPAIVVLVGGPPFVAHPDWAADMGSDGTARDGKDAPLVAERLLSRIHRRE